MNDMKIVNEGIAFDVSSPDGCYIEVTPTGVIIRGIEAECVDRSMRLALARDLARRLRDALCIVGLKLGWPNPPDTLSLT